MYLSAQRLLLNRGSLRTMRWRRRRMPREPSIAFLHTLQTRPVGFSTCGDSSTSAHDLVKDPGESSARRWKRNYLLDEYAGKLATRAKGTSQRRRSLCTVMHKELACFTLSYARREHMERMRREHPEDTSPTSIIRAESVQCLEF